MLNDHLKSTSALVARNGVLNVKYFYFPYGARRGVPFNTITAKHFTGQYHETSLPGGEGLSFYNARWYDPKLGRFLSADTIVPNAANPQSLNRYAYVLGNPLKFIDPTGHMVACSAAGEGCGGTPRPTSVPAPTGTSSPNSTGTSSIPAPAPPAPTPPILSPTGTPRPSGGSQASGGGGISRGDVEALLDPVIDWGKNYVRNTMRLLPSYQIMALLHLPTPNYTLMVDVGGLAGAGVAGRASATLAFDTKGGIMALWNAGGGGIAPGMANLGANLGISNAPSVSLLPGNSVQSGAALGVPVAITGELTVFADQGTGVPYFAANVGTVGTVNPGVAVWGTAEHSTKIIEFNVFNVMDAIYDWELDLILGDQ